MQDLELTITICSWNTIDDLRLCLESLKQEASSAIFEVIVIENASSDGSKDMVEREFPEFRLLAQTINRGFTGGHNLAMQARKKPHVALLNSDTIVHPGALATIMDYFRENPEVGIIGPRLLNPDGTLQYSCRRFPNPIAAAFRNTFLGKIFPDNKFVRTYLMKDLDHNQPCQVDWVSGAAMFIRKQVVDAIGGLDPEYFMYCEDTDYCKRAWDHGFKVIYLPTAVITHAIGRSTDKVANKMIVRFHRSMFRYYKKHLVSQAWWPLRPFGILFAGFALSFRALLFLTKNGLDMIRRKVGIV